MIIRLLPSILRPNMKFNDLLSLEISCQTIATHTACLLVIGKAAPVVADTLAVGELSRASGTVRVFFGLPILTAPYPILVHSLMTERNTSLTQLSLFGWIEDNAILEPRAEVFGLTPLGEDPVLFLRDLDLDRPPEAYIQSLQPVAWLRVAGVIIARPDSTSPSPISLSGDDAAMSALEVMLPPDAQPLVAALRAEVSAGKPLRQVLRAHRRNISSALMVLCDGWRVLAQAAPFVLMGTSGDAKTATQMLRLGSPRKW